MNAPNPTPTLSRSERPAPADEALAAVPRVPGAVSATGAGDAPPRRAEAWRRHPAVVEGRHVVRVRADELERRRARRRSPREWAGIVVVWGLLAVALLAVGLIVSMRYGSLPGDALSRVQAARGMVAGRDPHPEAIGFVWGPFPTLFEVPFAWFARWWPSVTGTGVAAVIVSAMALSAMALQLFGWGRDLRAPRWLCLAVVVLTLAHPLVWTAGVNGMSEAVWFLLLVIAGRRLSRWVDTDEVVSLSIAGVALGLAYLARFETLAAIAAASALVGIVSFRCSPVDSLVPPEHRMVWPGGGAPLVERPRLRSALLDLTLLAFPALAAVGTWSLVCWAIVGEPFPQMSSEYGNAAIVRAAGASIEGIVGDASPVGRAWFFTRQSVAAAAIAVVFVIVAVWLSGRTAWRAGVAVAVLGAPLGVQALLSLQGSTFPWFRYVASGVLLAGALLAILGGDPRTRSPRWLLPLGAVLLLPGVLVSTAVVRNGSLGAIDEEQVTSAVVDAVRGRAPDPSSSISVRGAEVADYIDGLEDAAPGAVVTDTSSTFAVVAASPRPELYVVPADRDFEQIVADPARFGVRYLLMRGPASAGDALRARFPQLWEGDPAIAEPVATWGVAGEQGGYYRLLRVVDPEGDPPARPALSDGGDG